MGHHGNHLEFCEQSENCFWGPKIFLIKYMPKKEHFEKIFLGVLWASNTGRILDPSLVRLTGVLDYASKSMQDSETVFLNISF